MPNSHETCPIRKLPSYLHELAEDITRCVLLSEVETGDERNNAGIEQLASAELKTLKLMMDTDYSEYEQLLVVEAVKQCKSLIWEAPLEQGIYGCPEAGLW